MEPSNLVKVLGAFVAGVVVALGSALIYVRVSDMVHPQPAAQDVLPAQKPLVTETALPVTDPNTAAPQLVSARPAATTDPEDAPAEIVRRITPKKHNQRTVTKIASVPSRVDTSKYEPIPDTADVAKNTAPPDLANVLPALAVPLKENDAGPEPAVTAAQPEEQAPHARQPHVVTLQPGMNLAIRLGETVSTDHNYTGDTFRATLASPIIMDGFIIADKGSKVLGRVVNAAKAGRLEGAATLALAVTQINTTDGQAIRIETNSVLKAGPSNSGQEAAKIAGGAALGAIIGAVAGGGRGAAIGAGVGGAAGTGAVLVTRGKPAAFAAETPLSFRLANPVTITEKLNY